MRVHMNERKSFNFKHKAALRWGLRRGVNRLICGVNFHFVREARRARNPDEAARDTVTRRREAKTAAPLPLAAVFQNCQRNVQSTYRLYWRFVAPLLCVCFN